ncbi:putative TonB-dependent outer membrane receptor protein [Nitritalea halalkaliphila LW7]|uniref:Putative TonB-dependent outer membrane receptor protein n=1 Tax=Nitritalea halalkaliphila LW7 TaxID=1189621 RepID=I5BZ03_9BACT|nr:TonB-dependent receptor [Nitritalea halalkaliphila]EIM74805.1 putative TonB-dependent outer membrane receptor protein [Nitritalea halalkaliphila LW7]
MAAIPCSGFILRRGQQAAGSGTGRFTSRPEAELLPRAVQREFADESGLFFQHDLELGSRLGLSYGLRYDYYRYLGPRNVRTYAPDRPLATAPILEETAFAAGEAIETYSGWGPRVSFRYSLNAETSLKGGYNRMYQFIHLISNTATIAPTDVWKLSDSFLRPQTVDQYSIGLFKNFKSNIFETSVELYYKDMQNSVEYIDGANLILQNHLETELLPGRGRAYGAELFIRKNLGRTTGWLSYTYSRSERQVITPFEEFAINRGEWFPSNFDKPHELTLIGNYKLSALSSFSATFTYSTGRPITFPVAKFDFAGNALALFTDRNQQRIPDFHRLDVAYNFKFNGKSRFADGDWTFSVMNVYGRRNPFSLFFADQAGALLRPFV